MLANVILLALPIQKRSFSAVKYAMHFIMLISLQRNIPTSFFHQKYAFESALSGLSVLRCSFIEPMLTRRHKLWFME